MRNLLAVLACLVLLLGAAGPLQAQTATTGQIAGDIVDPSGAVVSGAKITLTSAAGVKREAVSDNTGHYAFSLLTPGVYVLEFNVAGFQPVKFENVAVRITETVNLEVALKLAGQKESVTISAEPPLVQTSSATTGRVIGETQVKQLPLPTRNFQQLLTLSPGATANLSNNTEMGRGDVNIDVNGQRSTSNNVLVDGTGVNSPGTNSTPNISVPAPDAIQEFIVQTSMYDATQGRNTGGNIAVVTKSGSNSFHGSLYEFFRNDALNANDYFLNQKGRPRPVLKRNQFGATFGGPILKDKTFFFVSYQGTRERNGASLSNSLTFLNMPTALTDDRSATGLAATAAAWGVPAANLNPIAVHLLQAKLPNGNFVIPSAARGGTGLLTSTPISTVSRFREDQFIVNLDHSLSAANKFSGKFFFSDTPQYQALFTFQGVNPQQAPGFGGNIDFHNRILTLSDTHIFSPYLINQARFGYSRINGPSTPEEPFKNSDFGITNPLCATNARFCGLATIGVTGLFTIGSTTLADQRSVTQTFEWADMMTYTHGRHMLKFGGEVRRYRVDFFFNFFSRGQITFNTFSDFLQGKILLGLLGNGVRDRGMRATDMSWFVQDDIRVNEKLTLNAGFRLGRNGGISEIRGRLSNFDPDAFQALMASRNNLPCSFASPCTGANGFVNLKGNDTLTPNDWNAAPRFGFAYKPFAGKSLTARGGFGVYFDRFSTRIANIQVLNYPYDTIGFGFGSAILGPLSPLTFANPFPAAVANTTFPVIPTPIPSPAGVPISGIYVSKNFRTPYVYHYNFGLQWEPVKDWLVDVGYVGSKGTKLINVFTYNQGALGTAPYIGSGFSNNKAATAFQRAETTGTSHYDSLQTSVTKRLSKGIQFLLSYTFSKSRDDNSGTPTNELAALPGDEQNRASQKALSDFDRTHRLVYSFVYDLPRFYHGESGLMKRLANDWELAGIVTAQSGTPFSVICSSGATFNRANVVAGASSFEIEGGTSGKLDKFFNTAAFSPTCTNTAPYGTSARNIIRGPNQRNVDFSIVKFIPLGESQKVEFRTEFFNAFNWTNFANPINSFVPNVPSSFANLGKITSTATGPRIIQFALKYSF